LFKVVGAKPEYPVQFVVVKNFDSVSAMSQNHSVQHFLLLPVWHFQ
jgi:hypothetical protein